MRFVVEVITIDGDLRGFLVTSCSVGVFCAPVVSMYMSVVLRSAKMLRVTTDFGDSLTAADFGTGLIDSRLVLLVTYRLGLRRKHIFPLLL
jgi:hypothetical protein